MKTNPRLLCTPAFLLALALLLLNDFWWKDAYGNFLTGKLSDFAGLFAFGLFWMALFPQRKKTAGLMAGLWFVFWKSPYSQPLIDHWNAITGLGYERVVDYGDLWALSMLPLAYIFTLRPNWQRPLRLSPALPLGIAIFAFFATSPGNRETPADFPVDAQFELPLSRDTIARRLGRADSIIVWFGLPLRNPVSDTLQLEYFSDACGFANAVTSLDSVAPQLSRFHLISVGHCINEADRRQEIIVDFEQGVVERIR